MDGALLAVNPIDVIRSVNWSLPHIEVPDSYEAVFNGTVDTIALSGPMGSDAFDGSLAATGDGHHSAEDLATALSLDIRVVHQALTQLEIDEQLTRYVKLIGPAQGISAVKLRRHFSDRECGLWPRCGA